MVLLRTVAPYCLSEETLAIILKADPEEQNALLSGFARNSQQYLRYHLVGNVHNFMADKVLTQKDVYPNEVVKKNLGLIQEHAAKSFMEVSVYIHFIHLYFLLHFFQLMLLFRQNSWS
jgi:hypothetical protein